MGVAFGGGRSILKGKGVRWSNSDQMIDGEGSSAEEPSAPIKRIRTVIEMMMLVGFNLEKVFISFFYFE
jgi:hypothetical protein